MQEEINKKDSLAFLILTSIGVVFGDIGTSPLYALKSCFYISGLEVNDTNILSIISLFIWSLILIVSIKYVYLVMRINHHGEGGILAISSLAQNIASKKYKYFCLVLGVIGISLFFGDSVITPAISVLSALEGLKLISPIISQEYIIYGSIAILTLLFSTQKKGSMVIGKYFGPIMVLWFASIGLIGLSWVINNHSILNAFNPYYALKIFITNPYSAFKVLGGVVLVVTGAEALYADMGHFGRKPIAISWNLFVFPTLVLNYLGQGALLLSNPKAISNPFYMMISEPFLYPMIALSTFATIIASQAVITGMFSLTLQGIMLNYFPRMKVIHTSNQFGQVYIPFINYLMFFVTIAIVLKFRSSDALSTAYGFSVAMVMFITTILMILVVVSEWKWSIYKTTIVFIPILLAELVFVSTNIMKLLDGAIYPIVMAIIITYLVLIWMKGSKFLMHKKLHVKENLDSFITEYKNKYDIRIPECGIFLSRHPYEVPDSLLINLKHNKLLHKKIIFLSIVITNSPFHIGDRFKHEIISDTIYRIIVNYGFKEIPDFNKIVSWAEETEILEKNEEISFFLGKRIAIKSNHGIFNKFNETIYIFLYNNAISAYEFFKIPHARVIELGVWHRI